MYYFVDYNCKFIAMYKSVKACLNLIERKGLKDDYDNILRIVDEQGEEYNPVTGRQIKH